MKAIWNEQIIAESDNTIVIEGNHYFPENSIQKDFYKPSSTHTVIGKVKLLILRWRSMGS